MSVSRKYKYILPAAAGLLILVFFASCKTAPDFVSGERAVRFLPDNAAVLGKLDAAANPEILEAVADLLMSYQGERITGRMEDIYFAVNSGQGGVDPEQIFSLVIQGKFPKGVTGALIGSDKSWKKIKSDVPWWENEVSGMQIAVPEADLVLISGGLIEEMIGHFRAPAPKNIVYEALKEFEVSDMVIYIADPASSFLEGLPVDPEKFPLRSMWFTLWKDGRGDYLMGGVFSLVDEKKAKIMATLSKILVIGWLRSNKLGSLEEMKDTLEIKPAGASVRLSGISLDGESVIRLLLSFMPGEIPAL